MENSIIKHIFITNFHHKKGCEIEVIYPELDLTAANNDFLKNLPSLSLPDGAHNFSQDYVYFTLPRFITKALPFYGDFANKDKDITRSTVQKSICVLSTMPLFEYIRKKLSEALDEYFSYENCDFQEFLKKIYCELNTLLPLEMKENPNLTYQGLSPLILFELFPTKSVLLLFKLLLLEKKVLFYGSNTGMLTKTILLLLSLFPKFLVRDLSSLKPAQSHNKTHNSIPSQYLSLINQTHGESHQKPFSKTEPLLTDKLNQSQFFIGDFGKEMNGTSGFQSYIKDIRGDDIGCEMKDRNNGIDANYCTDKNRKTSNFYDVYETNAITAITQTQCCKPLNYDSPEILDACGFPLSMYEEIAVLNDNDRESEEVIEIGIWCPYLSLPYLDLMTDTSKATGINNCLIGASNVLFKQKASSNFDVIVDLDTNRIDFPLSFNQNVESNHSLNDIVGRNRINPQIDLRKILSLTSADARFLQYLIRRIKLFNSDTFRSDITPLSNNIFSINNGDNVISSANTIGSDLDDIPTNTLNNDIHSSISRSNDEILIDDVKVLYPYERQLENNVGHVEPVMDTSSENVKLDIEYPTKPKNDRLDVEHDVAGISDEKISLKENSDNRIIGDNSKPLGNAEDIEFEVELPNDEIHESQNILVDVNIVTSIKDYEDGYVNSCEPNELGTNQIYPDEEARENYFSSSSGKESQLIEIGTEPYRVFGMADSNGDIDLDSWIRNQFELYLISLLSTTLMSDDTNRPRFEDDFNRSFVRAYKGTKNYRIWKRRIHSGISEVQAGHPFQGSIGGMDVKIKLSNALAYGDKSKKIINEAALTAGKKLGFVWNNTKSTISSLFQ
ncbi:late secretory pathway protein AVL9 homolog isoform X2 [Gordionus sp. m RMFG-2023]|uniref:late secretory pathway protein AVL9 homolog isoform X2 n=1 Tax=Gordionus sp. m RMFG-2023 TaxID=3053472 RepID=UPI0031FD546C